ncbi:allantoinase AllB [Mesorhizobium japonicum]|uniref:allantoinase AllB n=1 Tax=Mesorhizobium TaxID=68287 RepID=UPI0007FE36D7|nr:MULTISPECIES: allantoinase AllB [Mesorhizobium]MUT24747.1 allantoinase AllB [Mesorhizobium japonicum]OBQ95834.1 allantoinase [Mesorhizobium sp. AA23]
MFDLGIKRAHIVGESRVDFGNLYVTDGKFAAISSEELSARDSVDASGRIVFPGGVDPHVHFNDPGFTAGEDFQTGSMAAVAGGITTVFEMPLTNPLTVDKPSFLLKKGEAAKKSVADFGLYLALTPDSCKHVGELMALEPIAFKAFMSYSPEIPMVKDGELLAGMRAIRAANSRIAVHCENNDIITFLTAQLKKTGRNDPRAYVESRPDYSEWEAVQRAVTMAIIAGVHLHVVHSSTPEGAKFVAEARQAGHPISVETAQHFLFLDADDFERVGPFAQCNPPLRARGNADKLWEAIRNGQIDCVGTDHAPYTIEEKLRGKGSVWDTPAGMNNIQSAIPLFLGEGIKRRIPLTRLARVYATAPAQLFNIYPKKGAITIGGDADMFLFDPSEEWVVDPKHTFYKQKWTPFEGMKVSGRVKRTWVRGTVVYEDAAPIGSIVVEPGFGQFIPGQTGNAMFSIPSGNAAVA